MGRIVLFSEFFRPVFLPPTREAIRSTEGSMGDPKRAWEIFFITPDGSFFRDAIPQAFHSEKF
ncbi:MAG: hypothetical protein QM627_11015 [Luteolibacter sp.]